MKNAVSNAKLFLIGKSKVDTLLLEARDRIGGRVHQDTLPSGHEVDIGPNCKATCKSIITILDDHRLLIDPS